MTEQRFKDYNEDSYSVPRSKKDIIQQITELTSGRRLNTQTADKVTPLVPTKAALFGLDQRFRDIE